MKSRSTQVVVGLCGNDSTITRGLGHEYSQASLTLSKKSVAGAERHLADVGAGEQRAVDVDRVATATAPGRRRRAASSIHIRWRKPSLAPMVLMTSVSGSSVDAEAAQVEVGDRLAQLGDAPAGRVAVVAGVVGGLGTASRRRCRATGRSGLPNPRSITSLAGSPGLDLQRVDDGEDVRRQRGDPAELHAVRR